MAGTSDGPLILESGQDVPEFVVDENDVRDAEAAVEAIESNSGEEVVVGVLEVLKYEGNRAGRPQSSVTLSRDALLLEAVLPR